MRYAVLGGSGYIGSEFVTQIGSAGNEVIGCSSQIVDCCDYLQLKSLFGDIKPDFVINAAGYVGRPNVDACEKNKEATLIGNVTLPLNVGRVCDTLGIGWGHVSSGCIYTGNGEDMYGPDGKGFSEEDPPNFCFETETHSFYSGTKALAEKLITQNFPNTYIWRLRIPFDNYNNPRNYLTKLLTYSKLLDATNSISHKGDFVSTCLMMCDVDSSLSGGRQRANCGIYNVCNPGPVTTKQITELLSKRFDREFDFYKDEGEFMSNVATYRSNCILNTDKITRDLNIKVRPAIEAVEASIKYWEE